MRAGWLVGWVVWAAGCSGATSPGGDCPDCDAGEVSLDADQGTDAAGSDGGPLDAGARDTGARDTGARDTGARDTGARDTGARDTGARDAGALDAGGVVGPPGDPATRDVAAVCARWGLDRDLWGTLPGWVADADRCANGTLPEITRTAGVRLTNAFRWLAGLAPTTENAAALPNAQACAVMMNANGQLSHRPPTTWACYSSAGAQGAATSNIGGGRGFGMTPSYAVSSWIDDSRDLTMTLGHRRWMLFEPLTTVAYGQAGGFACLVVLSGHNGARTRPWVAWPNAGPTPMQAMTRIWSFSAAGLGLSSSTRVGVTLDGAPVMVEAQLRAANYGDPTVSWDMPAIRPGGVYAVTVTGLRGADVRYTVRPVACD